MRFREPSTVFTFLLSGYLLISVWTELGSRAQALPDQAERLTTLEDDLREKMDEMWRVDEEMFTRQGTRKVIELTSADVSFIREQAVAGHARAQNIMGELYAVGYSMPQDSEKAREWFEKASTQNYAKAQYNLGMQYTDDTDGYVTSQDYVKARELWEHAAMQGYRRAESALGWLYSGRRAGIPPDYAKAREWLEKAAEHGDAYAWTRLAQLYEHGRGGLQDLAKARAWYEKAAAQGDARAMMSLGMQYAYGVLGDSDFAKALEWFEKAAAQGDPLAQSFLGDLYAKDKIVTQNTVRAYIWYSLAANQQAGNNLNYTQHERDVLARSMTPAQIAEAQRLTQQCQAQQFKGC